jgi:myo-inositol-1(or 4)-monophosphatase
VWLVPEVPSRAETRAAVEAVEAAWPLLTAREGAGEVQAKDTLDFATGTDVAVERLLEERLGAAFPSIGFLGEEGGVCGARDRFWLVDPICGTINFALGLPLFNINVALVEEDAVAAAALLDGTTGQVYWAERGQGAWLGDRRLRTSAAGGVVHVDFGHKVASGQTQRMEAVLHGILTRRLFGVRVMVTTVALAYIAGGRLAGEIIEGINPWDLAAGTFICQEAGAVATNWAGRPWRWDDEELVCGATPEVHRQLLELAQAAG